VLHRTGDRYFWMADQYPAGSVSLRSASADSVTLQAEGRVLGQVDLASANWMVHPQAVYLHEGRSYLVESLDTTARLALLRPCETDFYTEPRSETMVQLLDVAEEATVAGGRKARGEIAVTTTVTGYRKVRWFTGEQLGDGPVTLPPTEMHTTGYWLSLSGDTVGALRDRGLWGNDANEYGSEWLALRDAARARDGWRCVACGLPEAGTAHHVHHRQPFRTFQARAAANVLENVVTLCPACHQRAELTVRVRSGLAGLAHALRGLAPLFLLCDARDIGVHSDPRLPLASGDPGVVIYDQVPAGIGFADHLFTVHHDLMSRALDAVRGCACADGCPSCVGPAGELGEGGKAATLAILEALAGENA
jgi:DEAD/DEAH box helicase domain-containing protein